MTRRFAQWIGVAALSAPLITGCSATASTSSQGVPSPVVSTATAGTIVSFCQGVDPGHPANAPVSIKALRGSTMLADISAQVGMRVSFPVTPGQFTVTVNGVTAMSGTAGTSGSTSGSAGTGCPRA
jgi:hypothetical protein